MNRQFIRDHFHYFVYPQICKFEGIEVMDKDAEKICKMIVEDPFTQSETYEMFHAKWGWAKYNLGVEGDCCSHSWIEHIDIPSDIKGATIQEILDQRMSTSEEDEYEVIQVYNTHFRTEKGDIILEYRNSSNGYYGGYLVRIPKLTDELKKKIRTRVKRAIKTGKHQARCYFVNKEGIVQSLPVQFKKQTSGIYKAKHHALDILFTVQKDFPYHFSSRKEQS